MGIVAKIFLVPVERPLPIQYIAGDRITGEGLFQK